MGETLIFEQKHEKGSEDGKFRAFFFRKKLFFLKVEMTDFLQKSCGKMKIDFL